MDLDALKEEIRADWRALSGWREEAENDFKFYAGEQWAEDDKANLDAGRIPIVFNRVAPIIDNITGSEVKARGEIGFFPREIGDAQKSEIISGAGAWFLDVSGAEFVESEAFADAMICGVGVTETRLTTDENPKGDPHEERVDPLEVGWDRHAKARNLVDARRAFRVREVPKSEAREMADDAKIEDSKLHASWINRGTDAQAENPDEDDYFKESDGQGGLKTDKNAVLVVEVQWRVKRPYWITEEPDETGQVRTVELTEKQKRVAEHINPGLRFAKAAKWEIWRGIIGDDWIAEPRLAPSQKAFKWEFITGKRDRANRSWFGMMRAMKDPQRWLNSFLSMMMFILASNSKGGFIAEEGLTENHRDFENDYSAANAAIWVPDGALAGDGRGGGARLIPKPQTQLPSGYDRLLAIAMDGISETTGVNAEMLGMKDMQASGVLEYQRREAAMTVLASLFDSLKAYRIRHGKVVLEYIQNFLSDGRIIRITGSAGAKNVPLLQEEGVAEYDVIVDETSSSPNAIERSWSVLQDLFPLFIGQMSREEIVEALRYSPLPSSFIEKLAAKQEEPPSEEEIAAQQMEQRGMAAELRKLEAEAAKAEGEAQTVAQEGAAEVQKDLASAEKSMAEADILRNHEAHQTEIVV